MCEEGGTASVKSGLKYEKLSVQPCYFLNCAQVCTRVEGVGSEAPIRRMARWGLQVILHGTSVIKINFNPRVCFYDYFFTQLYGPLYVKQFLDGVKKFKRFNKIRHDNFSPV